MDEKEQDIIWRSDEFKNIRLIEKLDSMNSTIIEQDLLISKLLRINADYRKLVEEITG